MSYRIPLRRKDGSVVDYALVDAQDFIVLGLYPWYLGTRGYAMRQFKHEGRSRAELMHRRILGLERGDPRETDHINRNKLDNRRANLRAVTHQQNEQNKTGCRATSGFRNVIWRADRSKFHARVVLAGKQHVGPLRERAEDAARDADELRAKLHPFRAI